MMESPRTHHTRFWSLAIAGIASGFLLFLAVRFLLTGAFFGAESFHGIPLQSPQLATDFTLIGPNQQPVNLHDFRGKVVLLYFGYTFCPDACPATLSMLKQVQQELGRRAADVQVLMITVDPERDTPEHLAGYMQGFDPTFIGLSGDVDDIAAIATGYGIFFEKHEGTPATGYLVDHTSSVTVIDRDGYVRLVFPFDMSVADMTADIRRLLR